ncbi:hypothetical protein evm_003319 [Chilo suppressalis]|nr:hypothetical protein evm_003319 [Chilo suppressalis]
MRKIESYITSHRPKLVIDQDGGADDAMAIFIALLREEYFNGPELVAITTTHGNVNESQCFINTQRILDTAKRRDIPIHRGSESAIIKDYPEDNFFGTDGLGDNKNVKYQAIRAEPSHAVFILIELSKKYEGELIVVTIAPLTNIALALKIDPDFINRLKHIYVGAGTINDAGFPKPEFNALLDVEAYYILMQSAHPDKVTVLPFSRIKDSMNITTDWRQNVLGKINTNIMRAQNMFDQVALPKNPRWHYLDPTVMSVALNNGIVESYKLSKNNITLWGDKRGYNTNNFTSDQPNVNLVYATSENKYKIFLYETFSAEIPEYNKN